MEVRQERTDLETDITKQYRWMVDARKRGEKALEKTFEKRTNSALEVYFDMLKGLGQEAIGGGDGTCL